MAVSRRETLERLIPRLKIANKCVLSDRFLVVQGTQRHYKIHLGSGNILMEPNDQYLCRGCCLVFLTRSSRRLTAP